MNAFFNWLGSAHTLTLDGWQWIVCIAVALVIAAFAALVTFTSWWVKPFFGIALLVSVVSCAETETNITGYVGNMPVGNVKTRQVLYGQLNFSNTLFGIIQSGNLDIGFEKLANMATALVAAYVAGDVAKEQEITKQLASAGATKTQIASIQSAAKLEAVKTVSGNRKETTAAAISAGAQINPITVTAP